MNLRAFDSHLHFDTFRAEGHDADIISRAIACGVCRMTAIGGRDSANQLAIELARAHPSHIIATAGYDRDLAAVPCDLQGLSVLAKDHHVFAIGETGLDYHYESDTALAQQALFESQLEIARSCAKPVVIHSREADADTLRLLARYVGQPGGAAVPGVLHCFTGSRDFATHLLDLGFMISFSGIVTFRRSDDLRALAKWIPHDRILAETDAPYLAPVPHRGSVNEPAWMIHTLSVLAEVRSVSLEEIARQTYGNACRLFNLPDS